MNIPRKHFDEARHDAVERLRTLVEHEKIMERAVVIDDVFGKIRVIVWAPQESASNLKKRIADALAEAAGPFWSGETWIAPGKSEADRPMFDRAWNESSEISSKLRSADRHRTRGAWLGTSSEPPWLMAETTEALVPPIVSFYSFKGGVGRTTALAAFAIQCARARQRVVVIDFDLDAPGVGTLLNPGEGIPGARWGALDYLLEKPILKDTDLRDYYHVCAREAVTGPGEIFVVPAGYIDENYLSKLIRVDLEPPPLGEKHPLQQLLLQIRDELQPQWILLDSRAGLSDAAGFALSGLAHLNVLFGTSSEQSWQGLRLIINRVGAQRVHEDKLQAECLLVQAMVPANPETAKLAQEQFENRAQDEFTEHYYAENPEDAEDDRFWYIRDMESQDAPHVPIPVHYDERLAVFSTIDKVADMLAKTDDYQRLSNRITSRFAEKEL
ncbi:AAA family ATPase [candidate division KSB1 bacterium]|nr:AAA family ATPase [candidate division KSB1 bacterium]